MFWILTRFARGTTPRVGVGRVRGVLALPGLTKASRSSWGVGTSPDGTGTRTFRPGAPPGRHVEGPSLPAAPPDRAGHATCVAGGPRTDPMPPQVEPRGSTMLA